MKKSLFAAVLLLAACGPEGGNSASDSNGAASKAEAKDDQPKTDLLQALAGSADHKTLADSVRTAGLDKTLSGAQPYTLFAPTEAAFAKRPAPQDKGRLAALLTGHIVPGFVTAADLGRAIERGKGKAELATVGGGNLSFSRDGDSVIVTDSAGGRARITGPERLASNGVVHDVDGVLGGR